MYLEISRESLSGNWKYWSNLRAVTTVSSGYTGRGPQDTKIILAVPPQKKDLECRSSDS